MTVYPQQCRLLALHYFCVMYLILPTRWCCFLWHNVVYCSVAVCFSIYSVVTCILIDLWALLPLSETVCLCLCSGNHGRKQRKYSRSEGFVSQKRIFQHTTGGRGVSKEKPCVVRISPVGATNFPLFYLEVNSVFPFAWTFTSVPHVCIHIIILKFVLYCLYVNICLFCDIKVNYFQHYLVTELY